MRRYAAGSRLHHAASATTTRLGLSPRSRLGPRSGVGALQRRRGRAFAVFQLGDGTTHWQALAARIFEQIRLTGHRDLSAAKTLAVDGQFAAEAGFRVGPHTGAARFIAGGGHDTKARRADAGAIVDGAAIAGHG